MVTNPMPVPRTAEEAFTRYVLLRTVSPRAQQALSRPVDQPEHVKLDPVDDQAVLGELRGITGRDTGSAELLTLSTDVAVLYRAPSEQAGRP